MLKPCVTYVGTINDIQDRVDLMLITDSFEVKCIMEYLGYPAPGAGDPLDFYDMFVLVGDEDNKEVYAIEGCVIYRFRDLWKIDLRWIAGA